MERVTEDGGYPYLCRATPLGFRLLPPCRGGVPTRPALSIFVSPKPSFGETVKLVVPPDLFQRCFKTCAMQEHG
jgi:hypothetical protein